MREKRGRRKEEELGKPGVLGRREGGEGVKLTEKKKRGKGKKRREGEEVPGERGKDWMKEEEEQKRGGGAR